MKTSEVIRVVQALLEKERWTADRVGQPGCNVRLEAEHNAKALEAALKILQQERQDD